MNNFREKYFSILLILFAVGTIYFCFNNLKLYYFTTQINIIFSLWIVINTISRYKKVNINKWISVAITTYITLTGIVFWIILYGVFDAKIDLENIWLHGYVVVVAWILYFRDLPIEEKENIRLIKHKEILYITIYPILYFIFSMLNGILNGFYVYKFINPSKVGGWFSAYIYIISIGFLIIFLTFTLRTIKSRVKKYTFILPLIVGIGLLVINISYDRKPTQITPSAKQGVLDLSNWDLEKNKEIEILGEWEYYESQKLSPEDFNKKAYNKKYKSLVNPEGKDMITTIKRKVFYEEEYGTYRIKIIVDNHSEVLGVNIFNTILGKSKLWIQDKLVLEHQGDTYFQKDIYFEPHNSEFYITIQVDNLVRSLILGSRQSIMDKSSGYFANSDTVVYIIFVISIYHFILYWFRRKNKIPLYFAIMATSGGIYQLCANSDLKGSEEGLTKILYLLMNTIDFDFRGIIWPGSVVLICLGMKQFLTLLFHQIVPQKLKEYVDIYTKFFIIFYCIYIIPNIVNIFMFSFKGRDGNLTTSIFHETFGVEKTENILHILDVLFVIQIFIFLLIGIFFIIKTLRFRCKNSQIIAFSFLILGIVAINDMLNNFRIITTGRWFSYGLLVFIFTQAVVVSKDFAEAFNESEEIALKNIELNKEIISSQKEIIFLLGHIAESRSGETSSHIYRVSEYSGILAEKYGLSKEKVELIKLVSPMHDIGKLGVSDEILNKPGKLTNEEFEKIKEHAKIGYDMLNVSNGEVMKIAALIAYTHHEKYNGKGYPRGLKGEDICLFGRIVSIVDVFDALANKRVYKEAWELDRIIKLFKQERGEHFDPRLIDLFLENIDEIILIKNRFDSKDTDNTNHCTS